MIFHNIAEIGWCVCSAVGFVLVHVFMFIVWRVGVQENIEINTWVKFCRVYYYVAGGLLFLLGVYFLIDLVEEICRQFRRARVENNSRMEKFSKKEVEYRWNFSHHSCSICLQDFAQAELLYQLKCKHIFHKQCIEQWLNESSVCPNCRQQLLR